MEKVPRELLLKCQQMLRDNKLDPSMLNDKNCDDEDYPREMLDGNHLLAKETLSCIESLL